MDRQQSGFRLIELMVRLSSAIRLSVHVYLMKNNRLPETGGETGLFLPERHTHAHVRSTRIRSTLMPGTISIAYRGVVESSQA